MKIPRVNDQSKNVLNKTINQIKSNRIILRNKKSIENDRLSKIIIDWWPIKKFDQPSHMWIAELNNNAKKIKNTSFRIFNHKSILMNQPKMKLIGWSKDITIFLNHLVYRSPSQTSLFHVFFLQLFLFKNN